MIKRYKGILSERGKVVSVEKAFDYALERITNGTVEEKRDFVEWFYSGNWIEDDF